MKPLRLAAMLSGGGRTVMNIADRIDEGTLPASIELVIASRANAPGAERAKQRGLKTIILSRNDFSSPRAMHDAVVSAWLEHSIELICLCGYLRWVRVDPPFQWKIINIHPALLPEFGGTRMYGLRVHRAVLAARHTVSGCTVHFVDEQYDHGPIILQRTCPVLPDDDEHTLAARVFEQERIAYPAAIRLFAEDRVKVENNCVKIISAPE